MLTVTELAANAIAHSVSGQDGTFTVTIRSEPGWARIEVADDGPANHAGPRNGWGLTLVAGVTDRAGATLGQGGRRTAWAEVTWLA
jgi:two-component sensor histidine kinase